MEWEWTCWERRIFIPIFTLDRSGVRVVHKSELNCLPRALVQEVHVIIRKKVPNELDSSHGILRAHCFEGGSSKVLGQNGICQLLSTEEHLSTLGDNKILPCLFEIFVIVPAVAIFHYFLGHKGCDECRCQSCRIHWPAFAKSKTKTGIVRMLPSIPSTLRLPSWTCTRIGTLRAIFATIGLNGGKGEPLV